MNHVEQTAVWKQHAQQWSRVGVPLKPSPEDGKLTLSGLKPIFKQHSDQYRVAILGVTPELVQLPWPKSVVLSAYDHSAQMIASVWLPHPVIPSAVTQASWQHLPVEDATFHAAAGDGILNVLPHLFDYSEVLRELHRVMAPEALMAIRCFIRPNAAETYQQVVSAVHAGRVGNFHALKWRLAMSLVDVPGATVAVSDIHATFAVSFPSRPRLAELTGWPEAQIDTIDAYKEARTRYTFPTLEEMREQCAPYFHVSDISYARYELAERCPTLTLKRRNVAGDHA